MLAIALGVFAALSWSLHDLVARVYAQRLGPFHMALAVIVTGAILLTPFVLLADRGVWLSCEALLLSAALGVAYGCGIGGLFKALSLGPISVVGPVTATYPALVIIWNIVSGLWPTPLQWLAILATLGGAVIVSRAGHHDGGLRSIAPHRLTAFFVACAIAMLGYAAAVVLGQAAGVVAGEYPATWLSRLPAALVLLPLLRGEQRPEPLRRSHFYGIGAMGLFDIAGQVAVNMTGDMPGHQYTAIGIASYGGIATLLAALILKERVSAGQWAGIALIAAGVAGISAG